TRRMPRPCTSIRPAISGAGRTSSRPCHGSSWLRSSATSRANGGAPRSAACSSASASRDLPAPEGPRISTPRAPTSTAEAWTEGMGLHRRQAHDEARAEHLWRVAARRINAVLGPQATAMRLDDLQRDRQAQAGVLAEALVRAVGVEALEYLLHGVRVDARPVVVDRDLDLVAQIPAGNPHGAAKRRERARIVDQVVHHLADSA